MSTDAEGEELLGVLNPLGGGDPIPLVKERMTVGRRESCDICLRFPNVSSQHCELVFEQGYWMVRDLDSRNGTRVNGQRVKIGRLYPGSELSIAKHRFRVDYTPRGRTSDAEVAELQEDIMKFSLLERAGLSKEGRERAKRPSAEEAKRRAKEAEEEAAFQMLKSLGRPAAGPDREEATTETAGPAVEELLTEDTGRQLSDDEVLQIVEEGQQETGEQEQEGGQAEEKGKGE